mgnify:CR=1 FL=1
MKLKNYKVLLSAEQIQERIKELGKQITKDYEGKKPVVICTLKGAVVFFSDIVRNVSLPLSMEFVRLSSYKNGTVSGDMEMQSDITTDIEGRDVIIVEDIIDSLFLGVDGGGVCGSKLLDLCTVDLTLFVFLVLIKKAYLVDTVESTGKVAKCCSPRLWHISSE